MNSINIVGRIGNDVELKKTGTGKSYVRINLAVRRNAEKTDWFNCLAYNETAEQIALYFKKGELIGVTGQLFNDVDEEKKITYTKIMINMFTFCSSKLDNEPKFEKPEPKKSVRDIEGFDIGQQLEITSDDLPF